MSNAPTSASVNSRVGTERYFSAEALEKLQAEYGYLQTRYTGLMDYALRTYFQPRTDEYVKHGFLRRIGTMVRCIENVFTALPPSRGFDPPSRNNLVDAAINIQSFIFNIFGAIDNLGWIWVSENNLVREDGSPIPNGWIGLGPKNSYVRQSLPPELGKYVASMDEWFGNLENFRHSLAHRIPLYIPPYTMPPEKENEWRALENAIMVARKQRDFEKVEDLKASQLRLCKFKPLMLHSYSEGGRPIVFHAQLIADFMTIEELATKIFAALPTRLLSEQA